MKTKIYDCDRHVIEPLTVWTDYVDHTPIQGFAVSMLHDTDAARRERAQRLGKSGDVAITPQYFIGDHIILADWNEAMQLACAYKNDDSHDNRYAAMQATTQLASMDQDHITRASLLPTFATFIVNNELIPAQVSLAYAQGYNQWLLEYATQSPSRLNPVGLISRHDPANMVAQLLSLIEQGFTSVILRPEPINGHSLGDPVYEAFWHACAKHNTAVVFHGGTHLHAPTAGRDRYTSHFALHACSHPHEIQMAFLSLLESGVLERHPKLKCAFLEAGCAWLPHWLWRLDNICYPEFPSLTRDNIKMLPSEYFKRQCWVSFEVDEPCIGQVIEMIGHKNLVFASDFPHPDHTDFELSASTPICQLLDDQQLEDVLFNNAVELYHGEISSAGES